MLIFIFIFFFINIPQTVYFLIVFNSVIRRLLRSHITREFREQFDSGLIQYLTGEMISNT